MSKIDEAIALAKSMASDSSHGYDQGNRWGPDYDCSSFLISVWEKVGVPVKTAGATYTGNMRPAFLAAGFKDVTNQIYDMQMGAGIEAGDVLLNTVHHTAMSIGGGKIAQAGSNERGGITGGQTGDQTGLEIGITGWYNYPWDVVLRYAGDNVDEAIPIGIPEPTVSAGTYTVKRGDTLWGIAEALLGNGARFKEIKEANGLTSDNLRVGQVLTIPGSVVESVASGCAKFANDYPDVYAALKKVGVL